MSYYKEQIPELITNIKIAIDQCMAIVSQPIDADLNDDKLHAALKGKRVAVEDIKFYAKEVDILQDEYDGKVADESKLDKNLVKKFSKQ